MYFCLYYSDSSPSDCRRVGPFKMPHLAEEAEVEWFYEDPQDLLELIPKKRCSFHYRELECKSRKSRNTWLLLLLSHFSRVQLCATPETAAHQAPPSLGFSRQEHWSGLPFPSPISESEVAQLCPTLQDPMDCSLPGSFIDGICQEEYWSGVPLPSPPSLFIPHQIHSP